MLMGANARLGGLGRNIAFFGIFLSPYKTFCLCNPPLAISASLLHLWDFSSSVLINAQSIDMYAKLTNRRTRAAFDALEADTRIK